VNSSHSILGCETCNDVVGHLWFLCHAAAILQWMFKFGDYDTSLILITYKGINYYTVNEHV
jgi:hypothetical protein